MGTGFESLKPPSLPVHFLCIMFMVQDVSFQYPPATLLPRLQHDRFFLLSGTKSQDEVFYKVPWPVFSYCI